MTCRAIVSLQLLDEWCFLEFGIPSELVLATECHELHNGHGCEIEILLFGRHVRLFHEFRDGEAQTRFSSRNCRRGKEQLAAGNVDSCHTRPLLKIPKQNSETNRNMPSKSRIEDDDVHDALLPQSSSSPWTAASERFGAMLGVGGQRGIGLHGDVDPSEAYNGETQGALDQKLLALDSTAHRNRLRGWYSYAFARYGTLYCRNNTLNLS